MNILNGSIDLDNSFIDINIDDIAAIAEMIDPEWILDRLLLSEK